MDSVESPKLVAVFQTTRTRTLPDLARKMFASAKDSFEKKDLTEASSQFSDLLKVLAAPELAKASELADLRMLADGFAKLTEQQLVAEKAAPPPSAPARSAATTSASTATAAAPPPRVYGVDDDGIVPPVAQVQTMPMWTPPNDNFRRVTFTGSIEVVIDERGSVESARMSQPLNAVYDQLLLSAAKNWRYTPAMLQGQPVKYRRQIKVNLKPTGSGGAGPVGPAGANQDLR
jgi:TonB family protein